MHRVLLRWNRLGADPPLDRDSGLGILQIGHVCRSVVNFGNETGHKKELFTDLSLGKRLETKRITGITEAALDQLYILPYSRHETQACTKIGGPTPQSLR